jgi:mannan endo-1,4-beta-mannosidase
MLPRLIEDIEKNYPGTKVGVTEYDFGGHNHISGAIAMADALGIFGRHGVFAACWWGDVQRSPFINAALDLYLNYDGKGARFGDRLLFASTDDIESTSIHTATDPRDGRLTVVVINRTGREVDAALDVIGGSGAKRAAAYQIAGARATITPLGEVALTELKLAPFSVTMLDAR